MLVGVCDFPGTYAFPPRGYGGIERWLWDAALGARATRADAWWPGRTACLETSLTLVKAAALAGQRLHGCLGARFDPPATHAWAQTTTGTPVGEPQGPWPWTTTLRI